MKNILSRITISQALLAVFFTLFLSAPAKAGSAANSADKKATTAGTRPLGGKRIYIGKGSDNGRYISNTTIAYAPGDTFVLKASLSPYSYFSLGNIRGTAAAPVVIINEGGQVTMTSGFNLQNCNYIKIVGTGSADKFGFKILDPNRSGPAVSITGKSSDMEISNLYISDKMYGFWIKNEASCDNSINYPNWTLNNFTIHDVHIQNVAQEGFYIGSTAPNGGRPITCNGVTVDPTPTRVSNIKIYNNTINNTGRGGIQVAGAYTGQNEFYNNTITNIGYEFTAAQGNGIVLGGYTRAYVHDNVISNTFSSGIFALGSGLSRIENNRVENSGYLYGKTAAGMSNIMVDTRQTIPVDSATFQMRNNSLGANTDGNHIRIYNTRNTYTIDNVLCNNINLANGSTNIVTSIQQGVAWSACTPNKWPAVTAGPDKSLILPKDTVVLNGVATDADGKIVTYRWAKISGPTVTFSNVAVAQPLLVKLQAGTYHFRMTATDNNGAAVSDDVTVTVSASGTVNKAPVVNAGADKTITLPTNALQLGGSASDSDGTIASYNWTKVSGGNATFSSSTIADPTISGLVEGTYTFRLTATDNGGASSSDDMLVVVKADTTSNNNNTTPTPTAIRIQAENWSTMFGVKTETTRDVDGALNVGWQENNDWMDYNVTLAEAGTYTVKFRVATVNTGVKVQLRNSAGTVLSTVTINSTGGWQTYQTLSTTASLPAGQQTLRVFTSDAKVSGWNVNWLEFVTAASVPASELNSTTPPSPTSVKIEAENWKNMNGVKTETTRDVDGGELNVGWQENSDWMDYSVNIQEAGTYTVKLRVATVNTGVQVQLRNAGGTPLSTVTVNNTGGWQTYQTISTQVTLPAGEQTIRVFTQDARKTGWNLNWLEFVSASSSSTLTKSATADEEAVAIGTTAIYPNPVQDRFVLQVSNDYTGAMTASVYDLGGALVKTFRLQKGTKGAYQSYLSAAGLKAGEYFIRVTIQDWTKTVKMIKQ